MSRVDKVSGGGTNHDGYRTNGCRIRVRCRLPDTGGSLLRRGLTMGTPGQEWWQAIERRRIREKWERREAFAERARLVSQCAVSDPEAWIAEVLETESTLG